MTDSPFDTLESAHEYVRLLADQVTEVQRSVQQDITEAEPLDAPRRLDALRLVDYKLSQLSMQLVSSRRVLNDLRALRRVLTAERPTASRAARTREAVVAR